jgi:hypothetical protein
MCQQFQDLDLVSRQNKGSCPGLRSKTRLHTVTLEPEPGSDDDGGVACASHAGDALKDIQQKRKNSNERHEDMDCNGGRSSKRRRSEGMCMHVRFEVVTRERRVLELEPDVDAAGHDSTGASGDTQTRKQDAAERRYSSSDSYVKTKIEDGPCLIAQITSELVVGVSKQRVHNLATIMLTIRTTLVNLGWTTISDSLEFHVLCAVNEKLHTIIMSLQENGAASLLPGSMRIDHSYQQVLCEVHARVQLAADAIISPRTGARGWLADGLAAQLATAASPALPAAGT